MYVNPKLKQALGAGIFVSVLFIVSDVVHSGFDMKTVVLETLSCLVLGGLAIWFTNSWYRKGSGDPRKNPKYK